MNLWILKTSQGHQSLTGQTDLLGELADSAVVALEPDLSVAC